MNSILLFACFALVGQSVFGLDWAEYKAKYNKSYNHNLEETMRRSVFEANKKYVELFNEGETDYKLGLNHLSDLADEEVAIMRGFRIPEGQQIKNSLEAQKYLDNLLSSVDDKDLPESVDWTKVEGRVTPVKNQGHCGSCWAFSTTGALEGQMTVRNSSLIPLSEQNLIDCSLQNSGCEGGWMYLAWNAIHFEGGIESEKDYPYETKNGKCRFDISKAVFTDKDTAFLEKGNENALKKVVASFGPVSVAIDASSRNFNNYKDGIYRGDKCHNEPGQLDHAVLVVGYGTDKETGSDYWLVKNSWSANWGMEGYIKMARNDGNYCGIATSAMIPTFYEVNP